VTVEDSLVQLIAGVRDAGATLHGVATWPAAARESAQRWAAGEESSPGPQLIKHLVHDSPARAIPMARREADAEIRAIYSFLTAHPRTRRWHGSHATWDAMREIAALGHDIALHVDVLMLAHDGQDILALLERAVAEAAAEGLTVRAADSHSHDRTGAAITPSDLFAELAEPRDGEKTSSLDQHRGTLNLRDLAAIGIHRWLDVNGAAGEEAIRPMLTVDVRHDRCVVRSLAPAWTIVDASLEQNGQLLDGTLADTVARVPTMWRCGLPT
jgi:hypothetical protein